jgi:hypothetical protein
MVSHHGSADPKFDDDVSVLDWSNMANMMRILKTNVWLHGHGHRRLVLMQKHGNSTKETAFRLMQETNSKKDHFVNREKEFGRVMAPTTHLDEDLRPDGDRKGFYIISLKRSQKYVRKMIIQSYALEDKAPIEVDIKTFTYIE